MELIERAGFLTQLQSIFSAIDGEGCCMLISGESGIGKTSLVRAFCKQLQDEYKVFHGTCDALFTPRPLAPLYDIVWQMDSGISEGENLADRAGLFSRVLHELRNQRKKTLVVFEDVHWADEATLDFIKFFARRISQIPCLFILTFRDDEIRGYHQLRNVLGQLPTHALSRMQLTPLSREAVAQMAMQKGYSGEDVYTISGGNPFYVNEILASYSPGIPDNVKDAILSVYNSAEPKTKEVWQLFSILPTGCEIKYMEKMEPLFADAIEPCLHANILVLENGFLRFKHELYRRTIEASLSPLLRVALNKKILDVLLDDEEQHNRMERIIHHAKNANVYDVVVQYAPIAARQAAALGAHTEAAKLYFTAIEYYQGNDKDKLLELYEPYAYECYLTSRIREAIIYQGKALRLWKERDETEKIGNGLRFMSRLWWFESNHKQAESYALQAVEALQDQPSSTAKAMAYSNLSQLKMLSQQSEEGIHWSEKAIAIAREIGDNAALSHALNNLGSIYMLMPSFTAKGIALLRESLDLALKHAYPEHIARAYTNLSCYALEIKDYGLSKEMYDAGIQYSEECDLGAWSAYMLSWKARWHLEMGNWEEAFCIADLLLRNETQISVVRISALIVIATIQMRRGEADVLPLLKEAKEVAFASMELQRILPALSAFLEYEWITGKKYIEQDVIDRTIEMIKQMGSIYSHSTFAYWLQKARQQPVPFVELMEWHATHDVRAAKKAAALWEKLGCAFDQALAEFATGEEGMMKALELMRKLGANAIVEKLKKEMRAMGIRSIPRGIRKSTQSNPALLTERELSVLQHLKDGMQNKEIASRLFISAKTVDHHISSILFKLDVNSRVKAVQEAKKRGL